MYYSTNLVSNIALKIYDVSFNLLKVGCKTVIYIFTPYKYGIFINYVIDESFEYYDSLKINKTLIKISSMCGVVVLFIGFYSSKKLIEYGFSNNKNVCDSDFVIVNIEP